ncbi:MAG: hypothetical protein Q7S84_03275 [bacterium]|nr:hypothetical protein [bacterium]
MTSRSGFSVVALLAIAGVLVVVGAGYYWWDATSGQRVACTQEAKICPDGSTVGRTGLKCEFTACPEIPVMTGAECQARGGEVVNTLAGTPGYQPSEVLGEIREANCPCVCVKRAATSTVGTADDQSYQGVIAEFLTQWPEIQKTVPFKPVLGSTSWGVTAFQFLTGDKSLFLVAFEDGHVAAAAMVQIVATPAKNLRSFSILKTVPPDLFPLTADAWYAFLRYSGDPYKAKNFVTSVVRGTEVITFNGWVEVPENPFVWMAPTKVF